LSAATAGTAHAGSATAKRARTPRLKFIQE
jgi:hypothetical protein